MCLCSVRGEEEGNVLAGLQTSLILHLQEGMQSAPRRGYLHTLERHIAHRVVMQPAFEVANKKRIASSSESSRGGERTTRCSGPEKKACFIKWRPARIKMTTAAARRIVRHSKRVEGGPQRRLLFCQRAFSERPKMKNIVPLLLTAGGGKSGRQDHLGVFSFFFLAMR